MADGFHVFVRLTPKAARNLITKVSLSEQGDFIIKVTLTAVPEPGKANQALIKHLSKEWKIPKSSIQISKGARSRDKTLIINEKFREKAIKSLKHLMV